MLEGSEGILYHPRRRRVAVNFVWGERRGLSYSGDALEFVAEVLKVFLANL